MFGREPNVGYFPPLSDAFNLHDPITWSEEQAHTRARIQDTVDLYVSYAGARQKYFYDKKAKSRVFFVGQRVQLKRFPSSRGRRDKLLSGWEDGWFVKRIMPGRVVKAVEVMHEDTGHTKVISVDLLHIDPLQPPHPPPHMGIVRHPPPPLEDPHLSDFPLLYDGPVNDDAMPGDNIDVPPVPDEVGNAEAQQQDGHEEVPAQAQGLVEYDVWELLPPEDRDVVEDPVVPNPEGEQRDEDVEPEDVEPL
ncbi:hypothetical protein FOZ62_015950, partial [Perkinsus olseni]